MATDIKPGSRVHVTVTRNPSNEAAEKTLSRLFAKDPATRRPRLHRKKLLQRAMENRRRGGRLWEVHMHAPAFVQPKKGDDCKIFATSAVLGDLGSVARFVDVKLAK